MRHATLIATTCLAAVTLTHTDASACDIADPVYPLELELHPRGVFAQSVLPSFEYKGGIGDVRAELVDASGAVVATRLSDCAEMTLVKLEYGERCSLEPAEPLAPGDYTLRLNDASRARVGDSHTTSFTVTDDLPPTEDLPAPELTWKVVGYTDLPDAPFELSSPWSCGPGYQPGDPITARAWVHLDAQMPENTPPGRFEFSIETDTVIFNPVEGTTYTTYGPAPRATWTVDRFYPEFQPCVEATFVDVYGRRSETTELCRPDGCEVRDKNDRRAIEWDAVDGCSDWSPGYIERNAPGCACAQAPGRPARAPLTLALVVLGLLGARRRGHLAHCPCCTCHRRAS
jgi:MYXO-CTERM domain-containing protein